MCLRLLVFCGTATSHWGIRESNKTGIRDTPARINQQRFDPFRVSLNTCSKGYPISSLLPCSQCLALKPLPPSALQCLEQDLQRRLTRTPNS
ncbi:hypothetical protein LX36DRAFT_277482 [Colletotrichum falcatum]|nr:hypothetical protein LX36DRAFT_277482 [Colletotrichum falcatum]